MRSIGARLYRPLAAVAGLLGVVVAVLIPTSGGPVAAGLLVAVFVIVIASVAAQVPLGGGSLMSRGVGAVIRRLVPRGAQSDPDARGHSRPRAPAVLLPAV